MMRACQHQSSAEILRTKKNHPKVAQMAALRKSERIGIRCFQLVRVGEQSCVLLVLATSDRCARLRGLPCAVCLEGQIQGPCVTLQGSALHGVLLSANLPERSHSNGCEEVEPFTDGLLRGGATFAIVNRDGLIGHGVRPFWNRVEHGSIVARLTGLRNSHMPATRALILDL